MCNYLILLATSPVNLLICRHLFSSGDRKSKIADDDSDRGSEASSGSRSKKSNGRANAKSKGSRKKAVEIADEDSDTSQASGKTAKKKGVKTAVKMKKLKVVINKMKKERKKSTGEDFLISFSVYKICTGTFSCATLYTLGMGSRSSVSPLLF